MLWRTRHDGSTRCDALLAVRHAKKWCGGTPRYRRVPRHKSDRARVRVRGVKAPLRTAPELSNKHQAAPVTLGRRRRDYPTVCALRAAGRMGCEIVRVYKDHGISGAKGRDKRPEFDRLIRDANKRQFDMVMAWSVDRLGRSLQDLVAFLSELHALTV